MFRIDKFAISIFHLLVSLLKWNLVLFSRQLNFGITFCANVGDIFCTDSLKGFFRATKCHLRKIFAIAIVLNFQVGSVNH